MAEINRIELLQVLEAVQPGLSATDFVEQSASFVFKSGRVHTYNDEVACRIKGPFAKDFQGAVQAGPLLAALRRLTAESVDVTTDENRMTIKAGPRTKVWFSLETDVVMPLDAIDAPTEWVELHPDFGHAVGVVQDCVSRAKDKFKMQCVHVMPRYVEASDNLQIARYKIKSGIQTESLFKQSSLRHVVQLDATHVSETASWVHFRNPTGLTLSVRKHVEEYPDYSQVMDGRGDPVTLPRWLVEASELAGEFSAQNAVDRVIVHLSPNQMVLEGIGLTGGCSQEAKVEYRGQKMSFAIAPKLLSGIVEKRSPDAEIVRDAKGGLNKLRVNGDKWVYFTCLFKNGPADTATTEV